MDRHPNVTDWVLSGSQASHEQQQLIVRPEDSVSQTSRHRSTSSRNSSVHSSVMSLRIKEGQRLAEATARMAALQKKKELELARLNLKLQVEELKLNTEMEISKARNNVLDQYDTLSQLRSVAPLQSKSGSEKNEPLLSHVHKDMHHDNYAEQAVNHGHDNVFSRHESNHGNREVSSRCRNNHDNEYFEHENIHDNVYSGHAVNHDVSFQPGNMPNSHVENSNELAISNVVKQLRKPTPDIKRFSGDPLEFRRFVRQFKTKVVDNTDDFDERLNYLDQFTEGEANKIVYGFTYLDGERGYCAALLELENRYGQTEVLANAFVKRALEWPNIKSENPKSIDDFSIFLVECSNAVTTIEAAGVLGYPENMRRLVSKLPYQYHDKWRNIVQRARDSHTPIQFSHLVEFVRNEARKANDPTFGREALQSGLQKTSMKTNVRKQNKVSYATKVTETETSVLQPVEQKSDLTVDPSGKVNIALSSPCLYCNLGNHAMDKCYKLFAKPYEDRISFLKSNGLCFGCLKYGHQAKKCHNKAVCKHCQKRHPSVCHVDGVVPKLTLSEHTSNNVENVKSACSTVTDKGHQDSDTRAGVTECTMAIIPVTVKIKNGMKSLHTFAFLDPGSSASFISNSLLRQLGGSGKPMKIKLDTMGHSHTLQTFAVHDLQIGDIGMKNLVDMPRTYTKEHMPVSIKHTPTATDRQQWPHLREIDIPQITGDVGLLIGNDVPDAYAPLEVRTGPRGSPHATKSMLGWITWNLVRTSTDPNKGVNSVTANRAEVAAIQELEGLKELDRQVQRSIRLDFPEHIIDDKREPSQEDKMFLEKVEKSIRMEDGHYCIDLPFKKDNLCLPNNESQAKQRLKGLSSKMRCNEKFREDYITFMNTILEKGYAELVPKEELDANDQNIWYIPHHGVYHARKPEKIRVVFDCTATYQGVSLNSLLLPGPDLTNSLMAVLLRFRQGSIAIMADIEAMFFQVKVPKPHADCLRFLWWPNGDTSQEPATYRMLVHLFGAVSSPSCSNTALLKTADDHAHLVSEDAVSTVRRNFYVDDCLKSVDSEMAAINLIRDVTYLCQQGGFRLTKWISNSRTVLESVPEEERAKDVKYLNLDSETLPNERALGLHWCVEDDNIGFSFQLRDQPATRRGVLSVVSSIYDPLGLASPVVLSAKILLQDICRQGLDWDDEITGNILKQWQQWTTGLPLLKNVQLKRCYIPKDFQVSEYQMHAFSDASDKGYGVAIYLRLVDVNDRPHCTLVMGKSRVSPVKKVSIPRMELTAATVAVRLTRMVAKELDYPIDSVTFWTDSMSVLRYISNESTRFHTFVANRITVIRDGSEVKQWRYVSTKENPADAASRGQQINEFLQNTEWLNGPAFLWRPESEWPELPVKSTELSSDDAEVKKVTVNTLSVRTEPGVLDILTEQHSDWLRLKAITGWVLYAVHKFKKLIQSPSRKCVQKDKQKLLRYTHLPIDMLNQAETALVKNAQLKYFQKEIDILNDQQQTLKGCSLRRLDPFISEGLLRVGGRLDRSSIPFDQRHPIILPKESPLSATYLRFIHRMVGHLGRNAMLVVLRQKYWLPGASTAIKGIVSRCTTCRRYQAKTFEQKMAELPQDRVTPDEPPFTSTGMDYFGPFEVKKGRSTVKRYGVIFTCAASRAIHLELACSLSTDSCINAIRRFIARRGIVKTIRSDNGTNLVGSERELREEILKWNQDKISKTLQSKNITWVFNPPAASHHGGFWERLIRLVRKVLYSLLRQQAINLDDECLATLLCEVEAILNGRPITEVSGDCTDLPALTPNHLLLLRTGEQLPPGIFESSDNYAKRRWRQVQFLADSFWRRWTKEYLPLLQERQKWLLPRRNIQVNDIVLVVDNTPRNSWCLGRVLDVTVDRKGLARSAKIKTKSTTLVRPITKLCLIFESQTDVNL